MKENAMLIAMSLFSLVLLMFHLADDILLKLSPGGLMNLIGIIISVVWLYGTLVLSEQRAGHIIMLLGALFAFGITVLHMSGAGLAGGAAVRSNHAFFFVWTLLTLSMNASFSVVLAVRALWSLPRRQQS